MPTPIGKNTPLCGAKTRSGQPCQNRGMANGRCRMHGGASTGPRVTVRLPWYVRKPNPGMPLFEMLRKDLLEEQS